MLWFYLALLASLLTGFAILIQKTVLKHEHAVQNALVLSLGQALISLFLIPFLDFATFDFSSFALALGAGLSISVAFIYTAKAFRNLEVSLASPLFALGTVFLIVLSVIIFGERLLIGEVVGIGVILAGAYFVDFTGKNILEPILALRNKFIRYDLISVLGFTLGYLFVKPILDKGADPVTLLVIQNFVIAAGVFIYSASKYAVTKDIFVALKTDGIAHLFMSIFNVAQALLVFYALSLKDLSLVIPVYRTWILLAVLLGGRLFHEHNMRYRIAGAVLVVVGAAIVFNPGLIGAGP